MNLLEYFCWCIRFSICAVFFGLSSQQAHAYMPNTLRHEGKGRAETASDAPLGYEVSERLILTATSDETDLAECYGDELEVSLRSVIDADGTVLERTVFAFPNPSGWLVTVIGTGGQLLNFLPCQVEPISAVGLWGGFIDPRLGHGQFGVPGVDGVRVRSIRLSTIGTKAAEDSEAFWEQIISSEGVEKDDGFVHRVAEGSFTIDGGWLFPKAYLSPIGSRLRMTCVSPTCSVHYRLNQNLNFSYEIWVGEDFEPTNWIVIDQYVRDVIASWIEEN